MIRPHDGVLGEEPLFAGYHSMNGNGELTGMHWLEESGQLSSPIALTNSHSVGVVRDTLAAIECEERQPRHLFWSLPVVGETWDGCLNDIQGFHVKPEHVRAAYDDARDGPVLEGSVGGGTGMIAFMFKGGIGSSSRVLAEAEGSFTVGVLVQANYGERHEYTVNGAPVGQVVNEEVTPLPSLPELEGVAMAGQHRAPPGAGSIIGIAATDAPLLPHQCRALAQRIGVGVAQTGNIGDHWSGDIFLAFSTANRGMPGVNYTWPAGLVSGVTMLANNHIDALFNAVAEATQEAILNAMLASETMVGRDGVTAHALEPDLLTHVLRAYHRRREARSELDYPRETPRKQSYVRAEE